MEELRRVGRVLLDNLAPLIVGVAAMVSISQGPTEWVGLCKHRAAEPVPLAEGPPNVQAEIEATAKAQAAAEECRSELRFGLILVAFGLKFVLDLVNHQFPLWQLTKFRRVYLDSSVKPKWEELQKKYGDTIRINIMVARRRWWSLWLYGSFEFDYPLGFSTPNQHRDMKLHLLWHQGVAGAAYKEGQPKAEYLAPGGQSPNGKPLWRLWQGQAEKTSHVRWVLSVPMFKEAKQGEPEKPKVRGVINIDVTDDATARSIHADTAQVIDIATIF
jgi:hypothetical protein